jgi:hypothetical protein
MVHCENLSGRERLVGVGDKVKISVGISVKNF